MRKLFFLILFAGILTAFAAPLNAQVRFNVNVNLGTQPVWGPAGYDSAEYYYLPDVDAYYDIPRHMFYFNERGRWVGRRSLPSRYRDYDLYNSYKVVVNEREPWRNHETYRVKYVSYKGRHDQQSIRDSRDSRYFVNRNHPEHNNWVKQQSHDNRRNNSRTVINVQDNRQDNHGRGNNGNGKGNNGNGKGNNGNDKDNGKGHGHGKGKN